MLEPGQIVSDSDFVTFLRQLADAAASYRGSLEEYLRGVLRAVNAHERDEPTTRLIAQILADGLTLSPLPFDSAWLEYMNPPDLITKSEWDETRPLEAVLHMLRYQIADLHRMAEDGSLENKYRYFGMTSPTGHSWYNFDPQGFLACASSAMREGQGTNECTWADLVIILWLGQIYE